MRLVFTLLTLTLACGGTVRPPPPPPTHTTAGHDARMGEIMVSGRLAPEEIKRVIHESDARLRACSDKAFEATVVVRFVIGRDGSVVSASSDDTADSGVRDCIVDTVKALQFPQPEGGIVTVVYPLAVVGR